MKLTAVRQFKIARRFGDIELCQDKIKLNILKQESPTW